MEHEVLHCAGCGEHFNEGDQVLPILVVNFLSGGASLKPDPIKPRFVHASWLCLSEDALKL